MLFYKAVLCELNENYATWTKFVKFFFSVDLYRYAEFTFILTMYKKYCFLFHLIVQYLFMSYLTFDVKALVQNFFFCFILLYRNSIRVYTKFFYIFMNSPRVSLKQFSFIICSLFIYQTITDGKLKVDFPFLISSYLTLFFIYNFFLF